MVKKCFFVHKEVMDVFYDKFYITITEKRSFHMAHVRIIGSTECGKNIDYFSGRTDQRIYKVKEIICKNIQ